MKNTGLEGKNTLDIYIRYFDMITRKLSVLYDVVHSSFLIVVVGEGGLGGWCCCWWWLVVCCPMFPVLGPLRESAQVLSPLIKAAACVLFYHTANCS